MNLKEAFQSVIQISTVDTTTLELGLIEAGLNANSEFQKGDLAKLELAAIPVLESLIPISSVSEGGFSISTNVDAIKDRLLFLAKKHGLSDLVSKYSNQPKISNGSDLW